MGLLSHLEKNKKTDTYKLKHAIAQAGMQPIKKKQIAKKINYLFFIYFIKNA